MLMISKPILMLQIIRVKGYDSEDVIFTGWLYKYNTPEIKKIIRSQYGRGTDFRQGIDEYIGNNCYIPTSGICFIKCFDF